MQSAGKDSRLLRYERDAVYVNSTADPQTLVLSATKVASHSVLLSITTKKGTYVNLSGRIDKVVK